MSKKSILKLKNMLESDLRTRIDKYIKSIEEDSHASDLKKNKINELKLVQQELLQKDKEENVMHEDDWA